MARLISHAKNVSALITSKVSAVVSRRGYASASQGGEIGAPNFMFKTGTEEVKISWVPDPVTGYYRPENQAKQIDPAELRELLLKNKFRGN
ncbi:late embryogenesis abundant protein [Orobanche gracilis]